ncbi:MAG: FAD-dependent oxidoreductase [Candidatus Marinimicrobia bacterium]|nr:FAD-dependent oxidoreductase [Candidatus Neomarinimicrobiota bacterium]MCF7828134.1 FAD-dependent oxidoreductase [Candidatus Neomarinimicrobiota bacterium]MCF7879691.1 FAD-dependent oxidoreductase [Candidatus Neomarinimicrobiota bacterium]
MAHDNSRRILVIGGDAAGMSFASKIKREQPEWRVTVLERGNYVSYAACGIPYYVSRDVEKLENLQIVTADQFRKKRGVDVRMGWEAISIHRDDKSVRAQHVESGEKENFQYDTLMIATGADPVKPPIDGLDLDGIFSVRDLNDADRIHTFIDEQKPETAAIIGGGYIGLEMAEALRSRDLQVYLIEMLPQVLNPMDKPITEKVMAELDRHEVRTRLNTRVKPIRGEGGTVNTIDIGENDESLPVEMIILGTGIRPNADLAERAGLATGEFGGITVDDHLLTDDPDIYAAGDCVEQHHLVSGKPAYVPLGPAANKHGRIAALHLLGEPVAFPGIVGTAVMKVFDLTVSRTGLTESQAEEAGFNYFSQTVKSRERAGYYPGSGELTIHLVIERESGRLLGAQIAGGETAAKRIDPYAVALHNQMRIQDIALLDLSYAPPYSPVIDPVGLAAQVASGKMNKMPGT